nr:hypothetical protein [Tanacetum cinerariifolium]
MYPRFLQLMINAQIPDLTSHNTKYTSPALTQKVFANMRRVERDADRSRNGDDKHDSGGDRRRRMPVAGEIKKLEIEMWNLNVKGTDVLSYIQCFQELALMCGRMFPEEFDKVEKYVGGLLDMNNGNVMSSKPKTMQDAIEFATELMDQKIRTIAERQAEKKRKFDDNNQTQQQPPKNQNVARSYSNGSREKKDYAGTLPLCNKCKFYHNGSCTAKCANCKRVGYLTQDCRSLAITNNPRTLTCYECGNQRHYRTDCPELKNRNHENQTGGTEARGMVYALGGAENDQDLNHMEDNINA